MPEENSWIIIIIVIIITIIIIIIIIIYIIFYIFYIIIIILSCNRFYAFSPGLLLFVRMFSSVPFFECLVFSLYWAGVVSVRLGAIAEWR